ncbi:hypothetical protein [Sphingomonas sp.]|uniref:hypothetical protein n=1 Tax=Sphingomonas sp. TaxID=28214 RepID=UPI0035C80E59
MSNSQGQRERPERENGSAGLPPNEAVNANPTPKESTMCYIALLAERQDDWRSRGYNAVLRNPPDAWGEGDEGEPEGWAVDHDNLDNVLHAPDAIERFGFELFDLIEPVEGSCLRRSLGRHVLFAGQGQAALLDDVQITRIARCLERRGGTFDFACHDEAEIDCEANYQRFADLLRTMPVREFELTLRAQEGAAA